MNTPIYCEMCGKLLLTRFEDDHFALIKYAWKETEDGAAICEDCCEILRRTDADGKLISLPE